MHADRTNRVVLATVGLIALAIGVCGLLAAGGVFGHTFQHKQLVSNKFSRYVGQHGTWLWPAIAAVTFLLTLLVLLWLLRLLFSTDRAGDITVPTKKRGDNGGQASKVAGGRTTMTASALTHAVAGEIETYRGVTGAKARVLGAAASPTLAIEVTASRRADLSGLIERIEAQAITHAREALESADLPVKLDIAVTDKKVARTT